MNTLKVEAAWLNIGSSGTKNSVEVNFNEYEISNYCSTGNGTDTG